MSTLPAQPLCKPHHIRPSHDFRLPSSGGHESISPLAATRQFHSLQPLAPGLARLVQRRFLRRVCCVVLYGSFRFLLCPSRNLIPLRVEIFGYLYCVRHSFPASVCRRISRVARCSPSRRFFLPAFLPSQPFRRAGTLAAHSLASLPCQASCRPRPLSLVQSNVVSLSSPIVVRA